MLVTSNIVISLLLRTSSSTQSTTSSVLLSSDTPSFQHFQHSSHQWRCKTTCKPVFSPSALQELLSTFWELPYHFFHLKVKSDVDTFCFQFCHFLGYQNYKLSNTILHITRHYSTTACVTPNSKQSVTQQTLPYWHLVAAVCANSSSSSSVTFLSVQQPFCHTMCHHQNALGKDMWLNARKVGKR